MSRLDINPNGQKLHGGRSLAAVIADEEYPDTAATVKEEKKENKVKFLSFELDMHYPRTLRGFIRFLQIILLLIAFVALVLATWEEESQGAFTFYCIVLVAAAVISASLFYSIMAGIQKNTCCGIAWLKMELLYFIIFGFIVFIGACVTASNNSKSDSAINAGAAFGFLSCITYGINIFWTWKEYKKDPEDEEEEEKDEEDNEDKNLEVQSNRELANDGQGQAIVARVDGHRRTGSMIDPPANFQGDLRIDAPLSNKFQTRSFGHSPAYRGDDWTRSLEQPLSVISRNQLIDPKIDLQRRRRRSSEKDSAYSEGSLGERDRSLPAKFRRTASVGQDLGRNSMKRPRYGSDRRIAHSSRERLQELSAAEFLNRGNGQQRKPVPSWLCAALEDGDNNVLPGRRLVSTMPAFGRENKFPLLQTSDDESLAYPSVSQTLGNMDARWNSQPTWMHANGDKVNRGLALPHVGHHNGGKRLQGPVHRQHHMRGNRPLHGHHNRGHESHGNVPHDHKDWGDDTFLRRMMVNEQSLYRNERTGAVAAHRDAEKRGFHDQPTSMQFSKHPRYGANELILPKFGMSNTMIDSYLSS